MDLESVERRMKYCTCTEVRSTVLGAGVGVWERTVLGGTTAWLA